LGPLATEKLCISCKNVDRKPTGEKKSVSFNENAINICESFCYKSLRSHHFEILKIKFLLLDFYLKYRLCTYTDSEKVKQLHYRPGQDQRVPEG